MKIFVRFAIFLSLTATNVRAATITWDGGGGDGLWNTATNWVGDLVPSSTDNVVLDNSSLAGSYTVTLPAGVNTITVISLQITPSLPAIVILQMGLNVISGSQFTLAAGGCIGIGSAAGITASPNAAGNIQTSIRSFSAGASYEYNGSIAQQTGNGLPNTISGKLIINNSAGMGTSGVTLMQATTVNGELQMTNGKLTTTTANRIIMGSSSVTTCTYTDASFVSGPLRKYGNSSYLFPVGKGVTIHPIGMTFISGGIATDNYTMEYMNTAPTMGHVPVAVLPNINHISRLEHWAAQMLYADPTLPNVQVTLYATTYSDATDRSRLIVTRCSLGTGYWVDMGNANASVLGATGPVTSLPNGFFATDGYTLASIDPAPVNPLPLDLISFDALKLTQSKAYVNWELAEFCSPAVKFEIQRAGADKRFSVAGVMSGSETSHLYNYTDNGLKNGVNYYRLKMKDDKNAIKYSRTVAVMNGVNGLVLTSLIPTMISNIATLTISSFKEQKFDIVITDMQGRLVQKQNYSVSAGNTSIQLSLDELAAGIYQLNGISAEGKTNVIRFSRQ